MGKVIVGGRTTWTMTLDWDTATTGVFTLLGRIFKVQDVLETAVDTTVPNEVRNLIEQLSDLQTTTANADIEIEHALSGLAAATEAWQNSAMSLSLLLSQLAQRFLIESVHDDNPQPDKSLKTALIELERQMVADSQTLDAVVTITDAVTEVSSSGDGIVVSDTKWPDGKTLQLQYAEHLELEVTSDASEGREQFFIKGELPAAGGILSHDWPRGSGYSGTINAVTPADSLLLNSGFDTNDDDAEAPDDWIVSVGVIGTDVLMSNFEIQTLVTAGTPTSGNYWLTYTDPVTNDVQTTGAIAYNASAGTIQTALRKLAGLEALTVGGTTGTAPNLTHTVTFKGVAGNVALLTETNTFDVGTLTPTAGTDGSAETYSGLTMQFVGDGATLIEVVQAVALEPLTHYAWHFRGRQTATAATVGDLRVRLVDSIGGTTINDDEGTPNATTIAVDTGGTWSPTVFAISGQVTGVFRTPTEIPPVVYFELKTTTALTATRGIYLDHLCLVKMKTTYDGGPPLAVFSGRDRFVKEDRFRISPVNARDGTMLTRMERNFALAANLGKQLPTNNAGAETILDSLIPN